MKNLLFTLVSLLTAAAAAVSASAADLPTIVPAPSEASFSGRYAVMDRTAAVYVGDGALNQAYILSVLEEAGFAPRIVGESRRADIRFVTDRAVGRDNAERYVLRLDERGITAEAATAAGLLNALQTLRQLCADDGAGVRYPCGEVDDAPRYHWRAYMLDESRHFQGMDMVKRLLDEMARLKMNVFHWHLVDDPGWRIEIRKYPLLTEVGSKRDFSHADITPEEWDRLYPDRRSYYTQKEISEVVRYAAARGITVVPEIEMPAHASASIAAYPWLGSTSRREGRGVWGDLYQLADPEVEAFLHDVLDEVAELFPSRIIHIGGDEAGFAHWQNSAEVTAFMEEQGLPTCSDMQLWAINRMSAYLASKGIRMIGWNEITGDNIRNEAHVEASRSERLAEGVVVQFWDGDIALVNKAIEKGYDVVNSNRLYTYLDYPYEAISLEHAYSFDPRPEGLSDEAARRILGSGCQMWGERTPTRERVWFQTLPRLAAYAECGWTAPERKDLGDFRRRVAPLQQLWREKGYIVSQPVY